MNWGYLCLKLSFCPLWWSTCFECRRLQVQVPISPDSAKETSPEKLEIHLQLVSNTGSWRATPYLTHPKPTQSDILYPLNCSGMHYFGFLLNCFRPRGSYFSKLQVTGRNFVRNGMRVIWVFIVCLITFLREGSLGSRYRWNVGQEVERTWYRSATAWTFISCWCEHFSKTTPPGPYLGFFTSTWDGPTLSGFSRLTFPLTRYAIRTLEFSSPGKGEQRKHGPK